MKHLLLIFCLGLQGCATVHDFLRVRALEDHPNAGQSFIDYGRAAEKEHHDEWAKWDREYVSDDVLLVEVVNPPPLKKKK